MAVKDAQVLVDLLAGRNQRIELDRAALALAQIEYPDLDPDRSLAQLDQYAFEIARQAGDLSDGRRFLAAANDFFYNRAGFRGNGQDYYNPANSCLNRVLETKLGIPITLSAIYIEVARRLAKPVSGVGLPRHFIVRYDDSRYSALIDPFNGGAILSLEECGRLAGLESIEDAMLEPVDNRFIARRMINNLRGIYFARRENAKALEILDLLIAADPTSPGEHKQRAAALLGERRFREAGAEFRSYLELSPGAPDRERVEEQIRNIAFWLALRN